MNRTIIHFNNAGTGIQSKRIIKSISSYLNNERKYGGYEFAERFKKETKKCDLFSIYQIGLKKCITTCL